MYEKYGDVFSEEDGRLCPLNLIKRNNCFRNKTIFRAIFFFKKKKGLSILENKLFKKDKRREKEDIIIIIPSKENWIKGR